MLVVGAVLSVAAIAYGGADAAHGSGFLAVYLVGLAVGATPTRHRASAAFQGTTLAGTRNRLGERLRDHVEHDHEQDCDVEAPDQQDALDQRERGRMLGPVLLCRLRDLLRERRENADADGERRDVAEQRDDDPEVAPAPVGVDQHRDPREEDHEAGRCEDLLTEERRLAGDSDDAQRVLRRAGADAVDHDRHASADPDHGEQDVDGLEERVPVVEEHRRRREGEDQADHRDAAEDAVRQVVRAAAGGRRLRGRSIHASIATGQSTDFKACAACSHSSTSGTLPDSYAHAAWTTPRSSTRNAVRRATSRSPRNSKPTPNARTASPLKSESSPKFRSSTCVHAMCVHGESREMPTGWTPAWSKSSRRSRT